MPLPEMPVLFFPKPQSNPLPTKKPFPIFVPEHPSVEQQQSRLGTQFDRLNSAFETERVKIFNSASGITPEATLVIYTRGSNADFAQACRQVGFELLGEFDEYDLPEDEYFYEETTKKGTVTRKPVNKGRLFLTFSDNTAKDKLLSLWRKWCNNETFEHGTGEWKKIFPFIYEIKVWSVRERLEEFHILDYWKDRFADTTDPSPIRFEIELWCHQDQERRERTLDEAAAVIQEQGGTVFGQCVTIPEIGFQALKAELPKETLRQWLDAYENSNDENVGFFGYREIRFFRPIGQSSLSIEPGELNIPTESGDVTGLPLVAILDGHPLARHNILDNKLIIDDPDDFDALYESPSEYRHGTAMASLILHGDLNDSTPLQRPIYLRPVLQPDPNAKLFGRIDERIPDDIFPEDLVLRAVRRMFEGDEGEPPAAPTVKIINISLGDEAKPFIQTISSWGRLLDWLSWKYKILFIVSAGNCYQTPLTQPTNDFRALSVEEQTSATVRGSLNSSTRNRSILTPADSINSLTIGARHHDAADENDKPEFIDLLPSTNLMSPVSRHGPGYRRSLKPEVLLPGGRQLYRENHSNDLELARQTFFGPGTRAASPGEPGQLNNSGYSCGTSNAAAIASNGAGRIYEMLLELDQSDAYIHDQISDTTIAALIKTLIVHSTFKGEARPLIEGILAQDLPNRKGKEHISRFMGYGNTDIDRVLQCINTRGTVIGCSEIQNDTIHEYSLPLPACLHNLKELKRVIITTGWLSPVNHSHHEYRQAALSVITPTMGILKPEIGVTSGENDHNQIERGTVIHTVYEGKTAREITEGKYLPIRIKCEDKAGGLEYPVPYGIAVTIEVVENIEVPVYVHIREGIEVMVRSKVQSEV